MTPTQLHVLSVLLDHPDFEDKTSSECLALLSSVVGFKRIVVEMSALRPYMIVSGLSAKLDFALKRPVASGASPVGNELTEMQFRCVSDAIRTLNEPRLDMGLPIFQYGLTQLVAGNVWTQAETSMFDALSHAPLTRYEQESGMVGVPSEADINTARSLDAIAGLVALEEKLNSAHGDILGVVQQARAALLAGELVDAPDVALVVSRFTATMEAT